jgi:hypothetical protein
MGRRPHHVLLGLLVLGAVLVAAASLGSGSALPAGATEAPLPVVHGSVSADGVVRAAGGWVVTHPEDGHYVVALPGVRLSLDVDAWDVAGAVTIKPLGGGAHDLRFVAVLDP